MTTLGKWAWHVHHGQLVERLTEGGLTARRKYIQENKPESEIETRLRLLNLVKDQKAMSRISKVYNETMASAREVYDEAVAPAWKVYREAVAPAWKVYDKAVASARKALGEAVDRLHKKECRNCPWNGKTIFPEERM